MKTIIATALLCFATLPVSAVEFTFTGTVQKILALDKVNYGADKSHILITGFGAAGTCPTNDGLIALSFAMMTAAAGNSVLRFPQNS